MAELFDALQLGSLCKQSQANIRLNAPLSRRASRFHQSDAGVTVFVDAANGKDDQPMAPTAGSIGTPFKTVAAAVEFTRERRAKSPGMAATVFLRGNAVHYLSNTISLTAADSRLTIAGYNGEPAVVSGGVLVQATWEENSNGIYVADLSKVNLPAGVPALQFGDPLSGSGSITRGILARFPNANPEIDLFPTGYVMAKAQWRPPLYRGMACNPRTQCGTSVNVTYATPDSEWHGVYRPAFFVPTALFLLAVMCRDLLLFDVPQLDQRHKLTTVYCGGGWAQGCTRTGRRVLEGRAMCTTHLDRRGAPEFSISRGSSQRCTPDTPLASMLMTCSRMARTPTPLAL